MERWAYHSITLTILLLSGTSWADGATLRYGLKAGARYQEKTHNHNKGNSVMEMSMFGQKQVMETPFDQTSTANWPISITKASKGVMHLSLSYAKQQAGERGATTSGATPAQFANCRATAPFDTVKGLVTLTTDPDDSVTRLIYQARLAWRPPCPRGR